VLCSDFFIILLTHKYITICVRKKDCYASSCMDTASGTIMHEELFIESDLRKPTNTFISPIELIFLRRKIQRSLSYVVDPLLLFIHQIALF